MIRHENRRTFPTLTVKANHTRQVLLLNPFCRWGLKVISPGSHRQSARTSAQAVGLWELMLLTTERTGRWWGLQIGLFRVTVIEESTEVPDLPSSWCRVAKCFFQMFLPSLPTCRTGLMGVHSHSAMHWEGCCAWLDARLLLSWNS